MSVRRRFRRLGADETASGRDPETLRRPGDPTRPGQPEPDAPTGDSITESGAMWRRRHRPERTGEWPKPAPTTVRPIDATAPVAPSPLTDKARSLRRRLLPLPVESIERYLGSGEKVLHHEVPSFAYFLVKKWLWFLALVGLAAAFGAFVAQGWGPAALAAPLAGVGVAVVLYGQRQVDRYTSYVITNARMIRMSGVLQRRVESIPWVRVTDVHFEQSAVERLLGYATLHIESANETTGLRQMSGIAGPVVFNRHLMDMVVAKQGASVPLGRKSDYSVLPEPRGLFAGREKKRRDPPPEHSVFDAEKDAGAEGEGEGAVAPSGEEGVGGGGETPRVADAGERRVVVAPDPELPEDLSDLTGLTAVQIAADRRRRDELLGHEGSDREGRDHEGSGREGSDSEH